MPSVLKQFDSFGVVPLQKETSLIHRRAALLNERLSKGMMALNQIIIPRVQTLDQIQRRNTGKFSSSSPVAVLASQDEVPNTVQARSMSVTLKHPGKEMVNVRR